MINHSPALPTLLLPTPAIGAATVALFRSPRSRNRLAFASNVCQWVWDRLYTRGGFSAVCSAIEKQTASVLTRWHNGIMPILVSCTFLYPALCRVFFVGYSLQIFKDSVITTINDFRSVRHAQQTRY